MGGAKTPSTNVSDSTPIQVAREGESTTTEDKKDEKSRRACLHAQLRKTKLCMYHLKGTCQYGHNCAFAHSCRELHDSPDLRKTRLCKAFADGGCDHPDCTFAHGKEELRSTNMFYKKTLCIWHEKERCRNGDNCRFAHGASELRPSGPADGKALQRGERAGGGRTNRDAGYPKHDGRSSASTEGASMESGGGSGSGNTSEDNGAGGRASRKSRGVRRAGGGKAHPVPEVPQRGIKKADPACGPTPPGGEAEPAGRLEEPMKIQPMGSFTEAPVMQALVAADLHRLHQEISLLTLKCSQMQQIVSPMQAPGFPLGQQLATDLGWLRALEAAGVRPNVDVDRTAWP